MTLFWRHPERGKHHASDDQQTTLCGLPIHGFWQNNAVGPAWADEDYCSRCRKRGGTSDDAER